MTEKLYSIRPYANIFASSIARRRTAYSIDEVDSTGKYICQTAFWFRSYGEAKTRLVEIIQEDAHAGGSSAEYSLVEA